MTNFRADTQVPTLFSIYQTHFLRQYPGLVYYFPFKQNLFVVIVDKYVFHPQQLEKSSNLQQVRSRSLSTSITAV